MNEKEYLSTIDIIKQIFKELDQLSLIDIDKKNEPFDERYSLTTPWDQILLLRANLGADVLKLKKNNQLEYFISDHPELWEKMPQKIKDRVTLKPDQTGEPGQTTATPEAKQGRKIKKRDQAKCARILLNKLVADPEYKLSPEDKELIKKAKSTVSKFVKDNYVKSYKRALERIRSDTNYYGISDFIKVFGFRDEINPFILEKIENSFFVWAKKKGYKISHHNESNLKIELIKSFK